MVGTLGKKPSDAHVIWTNRSAKGAGTKRFDFEYLELWAAHFGLDYETSTRVDHERAGEPRTQHAVVFEWTTTETESIEFSDASWELGVGETPETFVELDDHGVARIGTWKREVVYDVRELWIDGQVFRMRTADDGRKAVDTRKLRRGTDG